MKTHFKFLNFDIPKTVGLISIIMFTLAIATYIMFYIANVDQNYAPLLLTLSILIIPIGFIFIGGQPMMLKNSIIIFTVFINIIKIIFSMLGIKIFEESIFFNIFLFSSDISLFIFLIIILRQISKVATYSTLLLLFVFILSVIFTLFGYNIYLFNQLEYKNNLKISLVAAIVLIFMFNYILYLKILIKNHHLE